MQERILFIVNPNAGTDRVKAITAHIDAHLDRQAFVPEVIYTQYPHHGTAIATEAIVNGIKYVVAVGGDGSVNDIVKGIYGREAILGILPQGSGNGLARSLGIPLDIPQAIQAINRRQVQHIDVGMANEHLFISNAGVGFDALVSKKFKDSRVRGLVSYGRIVLKEFWKYRERNWKIEIDGRSFTSTAFMVTVANATQFGYNFKIAPQARLNDGLLDIVIVRKHPKALGLGITLKAFSGRIHQSRYVDYYQGKRVKISHPELTYLQTDGDVQPTKNEVILSLAKHTIDVLS